MAGANSLPEALKLQKQLTQMLSSRTVQPFPSSPPSSNQKPHFTSPTPATPLVLTTEATPPIIFSPFNNTKPTTLQDRRRRDKSYPSPLQLSEVSLKIGVETIQNELSSA
ncbi:hypothetical protein TNCV_238181 [Trichonephila clavipes]|nr:hypothetical protein TNCV_238181 [Trichonephila clavipes]